ncbi:MAG: LptF/LptG family permease, partial [Anaerolineae bacterium]
MPIVWRYLLSSYFRVLLLCVIGFISVLLVMRFEEIALFASSGAPLSIVILFTLYQIPHILPIAIPISCLIAAMLLFQKMSHTHELTALRAAGLSLKTVAAPLLFAAALLSLINLHIAADLTPRSRSLSKELIYKMTSVNPLLLLQKEKLVKLKDVYIDMKSLKSGKSAQDVVMIINNRSRKRLGVMTAKQLWLEEEMLK